MGKYDEILRYELIPHDVYDSAGGGDHDATAFATDTATFYGSGVDKQIAYWKGESELVGDNLLWWDWEAEKMGVGTNDPDAAFHLYGSEGTALRIEDSGDYNAALQIKSNSVQKGWVGYHATDDALKLSHAEVGTDGDDDHVFISEGKLGIGITPTSHLHVYDASANTTVRIVAGADEDARLQFWSNSVQKGWIGYNADDDAVKINHAEAGAVPSDNHLVVYEAKVGIGTATPDYSLHVEAGHARFTQTAGGHQHYLDTYSVTPSNRSRVNFRKSASASIDTASATAANEDLGQHSFWGVNSSSAFAEAAYILVEQDAGVGATYVPGRITFATGTNAAAATERMVIKNDGKVGIATTTPDELFSVADKFLVDSDGDLVEINDVTYTWPAAQAAGGGYMLSNDGAGTLTWVNPSGVAGVTGTGADGQVAYWTDTSVLDGENALWWDYTNDRLGIGTTSPSQALHVDDGDVRFTQGGASHQLYLDTYSATIDDQSSLNFRKSFDNDIGDETETASSEDLGHISFYGVNSSGAFAEAARIFVEQDAASGATYVPGRIKFMVGTDAAAVSGALTIKNDGNVGINTNTPDEMFSVADKFLVDSDGDLVEINDVTYAWPSAQAGGAGYALLNDGSGNLSWAATSGTVGGSGTDGRVAIWSAATTLSSDSDLFWDWANDRLGVGTNSPDGLMHVYSTGFAEVIVEGDSGNAQIKLDSSGAGNDSLIIFQDDGVNLWKINYDEDDSGSLKFHDMNLSHDAIVIEPGNDIAVYPHGVADCFTVGTASKEFQVDQGGDIIKINNITYSWPAAQAAAADYILSNDGAGNLTWVAGGGTVGGTGAATQITYWSDADTITGEADFTYNSTTGAVDITGTDPQVVLTVGGTTTSLELGKLQTVGNLHLDAEGDDIYIYSDTLQAYDLFSFGICWLMFDAASPTGYFAPTSETDFGINTKSPGATLHLYNSTDATDILKLDNGTNYLEITTPSSDPAVTNVSADDVIVFSMYHETGAGLYNGGDLRVRQEAWFDRTVAVNCDAAPIGRLDINGDQYIYDNVSMGSELVTNGDMELDANWSDYGTPTLNERSAVKKSEGAYSRHFTTDAISEGIQSDTFTTVTGRVYFLEADIYADANNSVTIRIRHGDDSGYNSNWGETVLQDDWSRMSLTFTETAGGAGAYIAFLSSAGGALEYWIDDVSIKEVQGGSLFVRDSLSIGTITEGAPLQINDHGSADPRISFSLTDVDKATLGIDDSDSDKFKIAMSSALDSTTALSVDSVGLVTLYNNLWLDSTSPNDASITFALDGTEEAIIGIDNSDSDKFKIAMSSALETTTAISVYSSALVQFHNNIELKSTAPADTKITFDIGGTNYFCLGTDTSDSDRFMLSAGGDLDNDVRLTADYSNPLTTIGDYVGAGTRTAILSVATTSNSYPLFDVYDRSAGLSDLRFRVELDGDAYIDRGLYVGNTTGTTYDNDIVTDGGILVGTTAAEDPIAGSLSINNTLRVYRDKPGVGTGSDFQESYVIYRSQRPYVHASYDGQLYSSDDSDGTDVAISGWSEDGDATTTLPTDIKGVIMQCWARDSGVSGTTQANQPMACWGPDEEGPDAHTDVMLNAICQVDDMWSESQGIVWLKDNGTLYRRFTASGNQTLVVKAYIWGWIW